MTKRNKTPGKVASLLHKDIVELHLLKANRVKFQSWRSATDQDFFIPRNIGVATTTASAASSNA